MGERCGVTTPGGLIVESALRGPLSAWTRCHTWSTVDHVEEDLEERDHVEEDLEGRDHVEEDLEGRDHVEEDLEEHLDGRWACG